MKSGAAVHDADAIFAREILGLTLLTIHNVSFYHRLMAAARERIIDGTYGEWKAGMVRTLAGEDS